MRRLLSLTAALVIGISAPAWAASGDADADGDVDLGDFAALMGCLLGPQVPLRAPCEVFDFDASQTIDLRDGANFMTRFTGDGPIGGSLEVKWIHGSSPCSANSDPPIQVHQYNADTFILRQNKCVNFEAPFMYLLFGEDKVFLQDTGATASAGLFPIQETVQGIIDQWLADHGRKTIELIVTHSHGHGDHVAGDGQFAGQPNTTVVGTSLGAVQAFFGITEWPTQMVTYDLGGRVLDIIPIPGHHATHIAVYDRQTDILLTGDTLYPGFLFISNWAAYKVSIHRLATFAETHNIAHVLGTHIEMSSTPGVAYPYGTTYQPDEHVLQLGLKHLLELDEACRNMGSNPVQEVHDDFIITP
jgi:glyoxylase-like metal-dependent hydrolase (beta-lactamase superfamily II)